MVERFYGVSNIKLFGNRRVAASLIPEANKYLAYLRDRIGFQNYGRWRRVLPDGSELDIINLGNGLPPVINISSPVGGIVEEPDKFKETIVCEPTVFVNGTGFVTWGAPFVDGNGNPINPPMGTLGGTDPEVLITKSKPTTFDYKADHQTNADVGNIDWIFNPTDDKKRQYLSFKGPWGRSNSLGTTNFSGSPSNPNGYTRNVGTVTGESGTRAWYTRWSNKLYLDGEELITAPGPVIGASIAFFDNVKYLIVLVNPTTPCLMSGDVAYTLPFSEIDSVSPAWNNLGIISWGATIDSQVVPRELPHLFSPDGKKAVQSRFYSGLGRFVVTRLEFLSPTSFVSSFEEQPKIEQTSVTTSISMGSPIETVTYSQTITTNSDDVIISIDYNQKTGEELPFIARRIVDGLSNGTRVQSSELGVISDSFSGSTVDTLELVWPNSTITITSTSGSSGSLSTVGSLTLNYVEESDVTVLEGLIIDCRYEIYYYSPKRTQSESTYVERTGGSPTCSPSLGNYPATSTTTIVEDRFLKLNNTTIEQFITFNTSGVGDVCYTIFAVFPGTTVFNLGIPTGTINQVTPTTTPTPWSLFNYTYPILGYTSTINNDYLFSTLCVYPDFDGTFHQSLVNHLGDLGTISLTNLATLTDLINQPEYVITNAPVHTNPGVF